MGYSILCFSSTDWDGVWGSRQQVMLRFARRGGRVLFVEQPAGLEHLARYPALRRRRLRRWREGLRRVEGGLWLGSPPPLLPGRYYSAAINALNQWITAAAVRRMLASLGWQPELLWLYNPEQGGLVNYFPARLNVYHCIDEFTAGTAGLKRPNIAALERDLLRRAGLVFANSPPTYEAKRRLNPHTFRIPSGVDTRLFGHALEPRVHEHPALAGVPRPRLGYTGHLNERLDYDLLEAIAVERPGWSVVFAGDPYPWRWDAVPLRRLRARPNCHFLGPLPYAALPALLKGLDAALLPYVAGEQGHFRSPLKLYEYLAAGRAIVATPHPEAAELGEWVTQAATAPEFIAGVERALQDDSPQRRQARAAAAAPHDWDRRVDEMERLIRERLGS